MKSVKLSRLCITGPLNKNHAVPKSVIDEILLVHPSGIIEQKDGELILRKDPISVPFPPYDYSQAEISLISNFLNPCAVWATDTDIIDEFEFVVKHSYIPPPNKISLPSGKFDYGFQNPGHFHSYNACMLYRICRDYGIRVHENTTIHDMAEAIFMLTTGNEDYIFYSLRDKFSRIDKSRQISVIMDLSGDIPVEEDYTLGELKMSTEDMLAKSGNMYDEIKNSLIYFTENDRKNLLKRMVPRTHAEAITIAAHGFHTDISRAEDPIKEFLYMRDCTCNTYVPRDKKLKVVWNKNRYLLDLKVVFNPLFPEQIYQSNVLDNLARSEGYTDAEMKEEKAYSLLQVAFFSDTFYHGRMGPAINVHTTVTRENIHDYKDEALVSYGNRMIDEYFVFTYRELADLFMFNKNFTNPNPKSEPFSKTAIRKLKILCSVIRGDSEFSSDRMELKKAIEQVEFFTEEKSGPYKNFYTAYANADEFTKEKVKDLVISFMHLAFFMRGWDGISVQWPVSIAPVSNQHVVDVRVTDGIADFEHKIQTCGAIGGMFMTLPLLRYSGTFITSTSLEDGRNIAERLNIVKSGDTDVSCIRLSSNWFASTAYRIYQIIGMHLPFNIDRLANIS